jgi:hypothetical protein
MATARIFIGCLFFKCVRYFVWWNLILYFVFEGTDTYTGSAKSFVWELHGAPAKTSCKFSIAERLTDICEYIVALEVFGGRFSTIYSAAVPKAVHPPIGLVLI